MSADKIKNNTLVYLIDEQRICRVSELDLNFKHTVRIAEKGLNDSAVDQLTHIIDDALDATDLPNMMVVRAEYDRANTIATVKSMAKLLSMNSLSPESYSWDNVDKIWVVED